MNVHVHIHIATRGREIERERERKQNLSLPRPHLGTARAGKVVQSNFLRLNGTMTIHVAT